LICWFCSIIYNGVEGALERISAEAREGNGRDQLETRAERPQDKGVGWPFLGIALIFSSREDVDPLKYEFYTREDPSNSFKFPISAIKAH